MLNNLILLTSNPLKLIQQISELINSFKNIKDLPGNVQIILIISLVVLLLYLSYQGIQFIVRALNISPFDVKIHHINEQSRYNISKFASKVILLIIGSLFIQAVFVSILLIASLIKIIFIIIFAILVIIELVLITNIIVCTIYRRIVKRKNKYIKVTDITKLYVQLIPIIVLLFINSITIESFIYQSQVEIIYIIEILVVTILGSVLLLLIIQNDNKKVEFIFVLSTKDKPDYELFLDYKLNENTTILNNKDKTKYIIRKSYEGNENYEIFQLVKNE